MNKQFEAHVARHHLLKHKIANQRIELAEISLRLKTPLAMVDTGIKAVQFMRNHPALLSGVITAFLSWRKSGIAGIALQGWRIRNVYPVILSYVKKYLHPPDDSKQ